MLDICKVSCDPITLFATTSKQSTNVASLYIFISLPLLIIPVIHSFQTKPLNKITNIYTNVTVTCEVWRYTF